jgi:manganese/iron transport system ATP-binding protein
MSRDSDSANLTPHDARLELDQVVVGYNGHTALDSVTLEILQGAQVAVVGPNGAGKSTLFKAIVGLLPLRSGSITIHGLPLGHHRHCVGYIPQREEVDWRFPVTVYDVVAMGRYGHTGWMKRLGRRDKKLIEKAMEQMGIARLARRSISDLSGGQQQRVFLARTLVQEPHILLMDEPFNGVDAPTQEATLSLIDQLKSEGISVLVATHDLNLAARRFEKILLINRHLVAYGPADQVFQPANIRAAFSSHALFMEGMMIVDECCPGDEHMEHTH